MNSINGIKVTPREMQVYQALTEQPMWPFTIAERAGIRSMSMGEAGARYCISLTKKGLAQKHGTKMFPKWSLPLASPPAADGEVG